VEDLLKIREESDKIIREGSMHAQTAKRLSKLYGRDSKKLS
jgi:hypothetical protein